MLKKNKTKKKFKKNGSSWGNLPHGNIPANSMRQFDPNNVKIYYEKVYLEDTNQTDYYFCDKDYLCYISVDNNNNIEIKNFIKNPAKNLMVSIKKIQEKNIETTVGKKLITLKKYLLNSFRLKFKYRIFKQFRKKN